MSEEKRGYLFAVGAYGAWGFFPLYWHLFHDVPSTEILSHRILWSWLFFVLLLQARGQKFFKLVKTIETRFKWRLAIAALVVSTNWLIYIYSVTSNHVLESSLGYFINPLVNVFLGYALLKEKLSRTRWLAVLFASIGVLYMVYVANTYIWISLSLALTFGSYGLIRKTIKIQPLLASTFETMLLVPLALIFLIIFHTESPRWMGFLRNDWNSVLLIIGGVVTGLPLLWFTEAVARLPYSTMGFLQFLAPTFQFLTAVLIFHEAFGREQLITFSFIWMGVSVFIFDLWRADRFARRLQRTQAVN